MEYLRKLYLESIGVDLFPVPERSVPERMETGRNRSEALPVPPSGDASALDDLRREMGDCTRCALYEGRTNLVFGTGDPRAEIVFVGEGPGRDEDLQGEPFVGNAGQLLTRIVVAMGLTRDKVYICNVVKCRPPGNRDPLPSEIAACRPFLERQLGAIRPRVICALGSVAARTLLGTDSGISRIRGTFQDHNGIPVMPTFHPSYLLRNPQAKREVWEDIQKIMERVGLPVPHQGGG